MWTAHAVFEAEKSDPRPVRPCGLKPAVYTLELTGSTFTATSQYGRMFSIDVPADGQIDKTYTRPGDRQGVPVWLHLEMTGNVKSRDLEISISRCRYKLLSD
jgi:hypothetical protein